MTTPLNQIYRKAITFAEHPEVEKNYREITRFLINNNFLKLEKGNVIIRGRRYDDAIILTAIDFQDKVVCEVGARDGLLASYLTKDAKQVYVSDYFEEWGKGTLHDLGQFEFWSQKWKKSAIHPERLVVETQDITKLNYEDNTFDVVIGTSVINHLYPQVEEDGKLVGDIQAVKELSRVCKSGGQIVLSLILSDVSGWQHGTYMYSEKDLFERIINPSGCVIDGACDFDLKNKYNDSFGTIGDYSPVSDAIFVLRKP